ncbi:hypothetical protein EJC49_04655 [Aquibium carbonis]|uniref:Uncharacterized protein n=1 Tax=Aquibium carbonis TaxID=2495581 RepID=A0A3R9ZTQ9_9HYPH|nr:hypothetical protein [Aquibium carbonis]RST87518.1 hypothetical protein EJC49_04655 [Aquibium carbonis]
MNHDTKTTRKTMKNDLGYDPRRGRPLGSAKEAREVLESIKAANRRAAKRSWVSRRREAANLDRMIADAVARDNR